MGWGSSTQRGGGRKFRARPRKFVFLGLQREESGMSREFCWDVPDPWGCSKTLCKKRSQRKTKGQQLKGKIVSEYFTLLSQFFTLFHHFPPGLSPSKQRVLAQGEQKRSKDNKKKRTNRCCTLVVACLSS